MVANALIKSMDTHVAVVRVTRAHAVKRVSSTFLLL